MEMVTNLLMTNLSLTRGSNQARRLKEVFSIMVSICLFQSRQGWFIAPYGIPNGLFWKTANRYPWLSLLVFEGSIFIWEDIGICRRWCVESCFSRIIYLCINKLMFYFLMFIVCIHLLHFFILYPSNTPLTIGHNNNLSLWFVFNTCFIWIRKCCTG